MPKAFPKVTHHVSGDLAAMAADPIGFAIDELKAVIAALPPNFMPSIPQGMDIYLTIEVKEAT